jgi:hypothetical protein
MTHFRAQLLYLRVKSLPLLTQLLDEIARPPHSFPE